VTVRSFLLQTSPPEAPDTDDPFESVADFFDSGAWSAIALMLRIFLVALWLALAWWTYQDARRRLESPSLVAAAVALSVVLPFLGAIIWLVVRPAEYLDEKRERELELATLERGLRDLNERRRRLDEERAAVKIATEGGEPIALTTGALKEAGAVTREELEELSLRLTELEFRMRLLDRPANRRPAAAREERRPAAAGREPNAARTTKAARATKATKAAPPPEPVEPARPAPRPRPRRPEAERSYPRGESP